MFVYVVNCVRQFTWLIERNQANMQQTDATVKSQKGSSI